MNAASFKKTFKSSYLLKQLWKLLTPIAKTLLNKKSKKTAQSLLVLGGSIVFIVSLVIILFLFTGKVFVEFFGWLIVPFPKRFFKFKKN